MYSCRPAEDMVVNVHERNCDGWCCNRKILWCAGQVGEDLFKQVAENIKSFETDIVSVELTD